MDLEFAQVHAILTQHTIPPDLAEIIYRSLLSSGRVTYQTALLEVITLLGHLEIHHFRLIHAPHSLVMLCLLWLIRHD